MCLFIYRCLGPSSSHSDYSPTAVAPGIQFFNKVMRGFLSQARLGNFTQQAAEIRPRSPSLTPLSPRLWSLRPSPSEDTACGWRWLILPRVYQVPIGCETQS